MQARGFVLCCMICGSAFLVLGIYCLGHAKKAYWPAGVIFLAIGYICFVFISSVIPNP